MRFLATVVTLPGRFSLTWLLFAWPGFANAQEAPMIFLTSHAPTGSSAAAAVIMQEKLEEFLGRPLEYRFSQGANAGVGVPPDGNTMLMSVNGVMTLMPNLIEGYDLDPLTDLRPITRVTITPDLFIVRASLDADSIEELVDFAARSPKPLSYFHIAPQSIHRVELEAIFHEFGIDNVILNDSFGRGPVAALEALKAGSLDMMALTSPYVVPLLESGQAKVLAVINPRRTKLVPEVPTLLELGVNTMEYGSWAGLYVPAGTSDADANLVYEAVRYALEDRDVVRQITDLGLEIGINESSDGFIEFLRSETDRLRTAVENYGIILD